MCDSGSDSLLWLSRLSDKHCGRQTNQSKHSAVTVCSRWEQSIMKQWELVGLQRLPHCLLEHCWWLGENVIGDCKSQLMLDSALCQGRRNAKITYCVEKNTNSVYLLKPPYLSSCMAEEMACSQSNWLDLHSGSVIVWTGSHSAVSWRSQRRLSLQQLQDGVNIWHQLRLQPQK